MHLGFVIDRPVYWNGWREAYEPSGSEGTEGGDGGGRGGEAGCCAWPVEPIDAAESVEAVHDTAVVVEMRPWHNSMGLTILRCRKGPTSPLESPPPNPYYPSPLEPSAAAFTPGAMMHQMPSPFDPPPA